MPVNFLDDILNQSSEKQAAAFTEEAEKLKRTGFKKDDRYFELALDKAKNGFALIRFLPPPGNEKAPFIRLFTHSVKGKGWYIENSPASIEKPCPVSELYFKIKDSDPDMAKRLSRRVQYISNILVINHPSRPEDEGKVFLFKYGIKIFNKLDAMMNPKEPGLTRMSPFHMLEGANFRLRAKAQGEWPNYDDSQFDAQSRIPGTPEQLEAMWRSEHSLEAERKFKPYDELAEKLRSVLGMPEGTRPEPAIELKETTPWEEDSPELVPEQPSNPQQSSPSGVDATMEWLQNLSTGKH